MEGRRLVVLTVRSLMALKAAVCLLSGGGELLVVNERASSEEKIASEYSSLPCIMYLLTAVSPTAV